jgi:hypothetical protein
MPKIRTSRVKTPPEVYRDIEENVQVADTTFVANTARRADHTHVLLVTTGSVASIKAPLIVRELLSVSMRKYS